jgi:tRNA modification GTPase
MKKKSETIYALSTPPGKSAIAQIRISGSLAFNTIKSISKNMPLESNIATFNELFTESGEILDQTITTYFKAPKSFTGEDMVEITTHGSNAVIKEIYRILSKKQNTRIAEPGEFTRRAFENNKLDLTQVEAIADIVNAQTEMQRKQAISNLSGFFFQSTKKIFADLKKTLANTEAVIDFSEEDLPKNLMNKIKEQKENIIKDIKKLLSKSSSGISIRSGFIITILGQTNTGKSSFINNISDREVSIVTNQPGTTRDLIESAVDVDGYLLRFVDTAGIRKTNDIVEQMGVKKAYSSSADSALNIVFIENNQDKKKFKNIKNKIFVKSKQDIYGGVFKDKDYYNISSKTNFGIKDLLKKIKETVSEKTSNENTFISRERHIKCLITTINHLEMSKKEKTTDLCAEDIRLALKTLSSLFGNVDIEDILGIIFSDFCIGK